jgi:alkylation response protein AidB-like acyl-CoA dehydrogenase
MEFALSAEQRLLQQSIAGVLSRASPPERVSAFAQSDEPIARDIWSALAEIGVAGILIGAEHGGSGLGLLEAALAAETLSYAFAPSPFLGSAILAPLALAMSERDDLRHAWLPRLAAGEAVAGAAIHEAVAGARDSAGFSASGGQLTGAASLAIDAPGAEILIAADRHGGLHLVRTVDAAFIRIRTIDATRRFAGVRLSAATAEALPGASLERLRDAAFVIVAADMLGTSQAMLDRAVAYAKERRQFGRPIGAFQGLKHLLAEMAAALEPCRSLVWYAAYAFDQDLPEAPLLAAHAKAHLSEVSRFVARSATEAHGGVGFTDRLGLHYGFKRVGLDRQLFGGPEAVREHAARLQGLVA